MIGSGLWMGRRRNTEPALMASSRVLGRRRRRLAPSFLNDARRSVRCDSGLSTIGAFCVVNPRGRVEKSLKGEGG